MLAHVRRQTSGWRDRPAERIGNESNRLRRPIPALAGLLPADGRASPEVRTCLANIVRNWKGVRVGAIPTSAPFLSAVATRDGSMIYAMTGEHGQILAIDPVARRELRAMPVGRAPSLALIAP